MKRFVLSALIALASFGALAQTRTVPISNLPPAAVPFTGSELFALVQNGITRKGLLSNLTPFLAGALLQETNFLTYGTPGSSDDTPAFNAFIDACAAGPTKQCFMPPGNYNFTSRPNCLHGQINLFGAGIGPTVIYRNYNETDPTRGLFCISSFAANDSSIGNMGIYGKAGTTGGSLISINQPVGPPIGFLHFHDMVLSTTGNCTTEYMLYMNGTLNSVAPIGIRDDNFDNITVFGAKTYSIYGAGLVGFSLMGGGVFPAGCTSSASGDVVFGGTPAVQTTEVMVVNQTIQGQLSFDNTINATILTNSLGSVGGTSVTNSATVDSVSVMAGNIAGACQTNWTNSACVLTTGKFAVSGFTPNNPTGTTSATQVMMGFGGVASITPLISSRAVITVSGDIFNASTIGDGAAFSIRFGTGTPPSNGDAVTGTLCGTTSTKYVASTTAGKGVFSQSCIATGLTPGTPYWIDLGLSNITGGTATVNDVTIIAHGI
jgi:hypothetical protein